jgi:hypothetical protein
MCPTIYQTRYFFNNSKTNEDIATRFEQQYVRCVRNEEECVCSGCLFRFTIFIGFRIIKEMPGFVGSGTPYITYCECVFVALVSSIQYACAVLCSRPACMALQNFFTLSYKLHDFRGKNCWTWNFCLIFSTIFFQKFFLSVNNQARPYHDCT